MYGLFALTSPPYASLTYALPPEFPSDFWRPGLRVAVPLGRGSVLRMAVLLHCSETCDASISSRIRPVAWPLEERPILPEKLLDLMKDLASRQCILPGHVLGHVLPAGLRSTQARLHHIEDGKALTFAIRDLLTMDSDRRKALANALCSGLARMLPKAVDAANEEWCRLSVNPPWPVRPMATMQLAVLEYLHANPATTRRRLLQTLGQRAATALKQLLSYGHVRIEREDDSPETQMQQVLMPPPPAPFDLNSDQQQVLRDCCSTLDKQSSDPTGATRLLFGVTGSGKTAVYLELAKHCLALGRSMLLLAPEVALAHKLRRDAALALPQTEVVLYHGYQSPTQRERIYRRMAISDKPCLVVGTRSSLFLPLPQLGCIVLDEEHDGSYKQEEGFCYQAKEVAWFRIRQTGGLLLLASATPDIKSFYASEQQALPLSRMPVRVGGKELPPVTLVDIGKNATTLLAPQSETALQETLKRGEQAVILLNRRGYAPLMYCLECNTTQHCPNCAIGLTYHKATEKLICHYCGFARPFPSPCEKCHNLNFLPLGEGTERLSEALASIVDGPVLRLDRDTARRADRMEEILASFARQEAQVLVGTQMLSKGHHFPNVTLAIVADADLGLNLPDYRAPERTFQLLLQSAGRAGRGERSGRVLLQSRDIQHYCWQYILNADYEGFYRDELERRRKRNYPPFVRLGLLRISHPMEDGRASAALGELGKSLREQATRCNVRLLGPAAAPLALIRGKRRFQCLIKAGDWQDIRKFYLLAQSLPAARVLQLALDLDPLNML